MSGLQGRKAYIRAAHQEAFNIRKNIAEEMMDTLHVVTPVLTGTLVAGYDIEESREATYIVNPVEYHDAVNDGTDKMAPRGMIEMAIARVNGDARKYQGR